MVYLAQLRIEHVVSEKKESIETDKHRCSSVVHLLRDREFRFRNVLTGNTTWCSKHKTWQVL